jgi:putative phosphoserine phosphatase/1-acylglycerol-3-phosphate O-acyltransferase
MSDALRTAPSGPETGAFFDLDRTVLAGFSALALGRDLLLTGRLGPANLPSRLWRSLLLGREGEGFSELMDAIAAMLRGTPERRLVEFGERLFREEHRERVYPEARQLIESHRARGHTLVLATAATSYQALPIAKFLGIDSVLSTRFAVENGRLAGHVLRPTGWGPGKFAAVREFSEAHGVKLAQSFAYSDGKEDVPLLSGVGHPYAVNPDDELARVAEAAGWPVLRFDSRTAPDLRELLEPLRAHPLRYAYFGALAYVEAEQERWRTGAGWRRGWSAGWWNGR